MILTFRIDAVERLRLALLVHPFEHARHESVLVRPILIHTFERRPELLRVDGPVPKRSAARKMSGLEGTHIICCGICRGL